MIHLKKIRFLPVLLVSILFLGGCITPSDGKNQTLGTLLGAGVGALVGSQIGSGKGKLVAVAIGALGGALFGNRIGKSMDDVDRMKAAKAQQVALDTRPIGSPVRWSNPDSGHYGWVKPGFAFRTSAGEWCRPYEHTIIIDGRQETMTGTACRNPDGTWRVR